MRIKTSVPEFVGSVISCLSKYSNEWEVMSLGTMCSSELIDGMTNPYVITLRNSSTGSEAREYLPYYREVKEGNDIECR